MKKSEKAINYAKSLKRRADYIAKSALSEEEMPPIRVPPEKWTARMAICTPCFDNVEGECNRCGCPVAAKSRWETEDCEEWNK